MAYGLACLAAYLKHHGIDKREYEEEIKLLSSYTQSTNLPQWDEDAKSFLFSKYPDEQLKGIPHMFECLYYVGIGDMYGAYQSASLEEFSCVADLLNKENIPLPDIEEFNAYVLTGPVQDDDYFGSTFVCPDYFR